MDKAIFHKIIVMACFEGASLDLPLKYDQQWSDWIDDASGQQRVISGEATIEDVDAKHKEVAIRVDGEDAKDGRRSSCMIYARFDGTVREVEPWS